MNERDKIYDEICKTLTEYEEGNDMITELTFYDLLCKIQNNWESVITKQED